MIFDVDINKENNVFRRSSNMQKFWRVDNIE